jgi:hypothetical protein
VPHVTPLRTEDADRVGRYRLTGRISGMPGTGPVFLAAARDGTQVALRLLRGQWTRDAAARDRFAAEAGAASQVPPFCAARILDAGVADDLAYLVSEYVAGRSLLETVSDDGELGGATLEALGIGSATGLASVHEAGLVHGSFGPEHVILGAAGPRVIEYGITPPYGPATPSADMLAWAQTMVFAAVGRPPATFADLDALPGSLRQAVADCLAGDPGARSSARAVVVELLDGVQPGSGLLAEGSRRAAAAAAARNGAGIGGRAGTGSRGGADLRGGRPYQDEWDEGDRRGRDLAARDRGSRDRGPGRPMRAGQDRPDPRRQGGARGEARGRPRRRAGWLPAAAAVVLVGVIAFVITLVMHGSGSTGGQTASAGHTGSTRPASGSASPSASPRPSVKVTVPASFAGSWSGLAAQQNPSNEFDVRLQLAARSARGSVVYTSGSFSCAGQLSVAAAGTGTLTLNQGGGGSKHGCPHGEVTLTESDGTLKFTFRGRTGPTASGTLTKT